MYAYIKCIEFAVFCLITATRAMLIEEWHMNQLLAKPFWETLISTYPNAQILDFNQRTVSVAELFDPCPFDGQIVNQRNFNDKVRQFYNLLTIVFSDALAWNLRYFEILKRFHSQNDLSWDLNSHIMTYAVESNQNYSAMYSVLSLIRSMYRDAPPLDRQLYTDLRNLVIIAWFSPTEMFRVLWQTKDRLTETLNNNPHIETWSNRTTGVPARYIHMVSMATSECTEKGGTPYELSHLKVVNEQYFQIFREIGFAYDKNTSVASFISIYAQQ